MNLDLTFDIGPTLTAFRANDETNSPAIPYCDPGLVSITHTEPSTILTLLTRNLGLLPNC